MARAIERGLSVGKLVGRLLHSPWTILLSMVVGTIIGNTHKELAAVLGPFGSLYLTLLQMCVLPIMITAVIAGLGNLFRTGKAALYLKRMIAIYVLGLCLVAIASLSVSLLTKPGKQLTEDDKLVISEQLAKAETVKTLDVQPEKPHTAVGKIIDFVGNIVPSNVFAAMSQGQNLAVLFFCLALGIALGKSRVEGANITLKVLEAANDALLMIVTWTMYGLPLGLCCLLAGYIAQTGLGILLVLFKFVLLYCLISLVLMVIYSLIIWRRTGQTYIQTWLALKEPLIIAFSTRSSFAAMPATLTSMHEKLKMNKQTVDLLVPVGIMLNPMGSVAHYCLVAVFMSQLYGLPFGSEQFIITIVTSIGASIAATGVPSIAALGILPMVLNPLGLPVNVGMLLVAAVDTFADTLVTVLNIHGNCAAATLVADKQTIAIE
ncbi:MAG: sodium:dicarboxylate symporter [Gammaproteobacteria bacterium]|jgi:proton glutamate symport protein|nr:sodium:dicarboxylate symporter [Gammaproteobacteria bacterium]